MTLSVSKPAKQTKVFKCYQLPVRGIKLSLVNEWHEAVELLFSEEHRWLFRRAQVCFLSHQRAQNKLQNKALKEIHSKARLARNDL